MFLNSIPPKQGHLVFKSSPNYEVPLDLGKDNQYEITIRVYDSNESDAMPVDQSFSILVNDVNEEPSFLLHHPHFGLTTHTLKARVRLWFSKITSAMWMAG